MNKDPEEVFEGDASPTASNLPSLRYESASDVALARRVLRKIDLRLMPIMFLSYVLNYTDKAILSSASVFGLSTDTVRLLFCVHFEQGSRVNTASRWTTVQLGIQHLLLWLPGMDIPYNDPDPEATCWTICFHQHHYLGSYCSMHGTLHQFWRLSHYSLFARCRRSYNNPCIHLYYFDVVYAGGNTIPDWDLVCWEFVRRICRKCVGVCHWKDREFDLALAVVVHCELFVLERQS